jgi:hypothetical protein
MAQDSGWEDFKQLGKWAYAKATSHPISKIEGTLNTGKPPATPQAAPVYNPKPRTPKRPKVQKRTKKVSKR